HWASKFRVFAMRTLLIIAAAIMSVSAAQAQEMLPAKSATPPAVQESNDRAMPVATPTSALIDQLKAAGELKDPKDTKDPKTALEAPVPRLEPVQEAKPAQTGPDQVKQIEVVPAPAKAAETPAVAKPAETKPVVTPPVAAAPGTTPPTA